MLIVAIIIILILIYLFYRYRTSARTVSSHRGHRKKRNKSLLSRALDTLQGRDKSKTDEYKIYQQGRAIETEILNNGAPLNAKQGQQVRRHYQNAIINIDRNIHDRELTREELDEYIEIIDHVTNAAQGINNFYMPAYNDNLDFGPLLNDVDARLRALDTDEKINYIRANASSENKAENVTAYFDASVTYTNDDQNVHDTKVVSGLRNIYGRLQNSPSQLHDSNTLLSTINKYIDTLPDISETKKKKAMITLTKLCNNPENLVWLDGAQELDVLKTVWARTEDPRNATSSRAMKDLVVDALADAVEDNGTLMCSTGRAGRLLSAFTTVDFDPAISESPVMTYEMYKNQIFTESSNILKTEIASLPETDASLKKYFDTGARDDTLKQEDITKFEGQLKDRIDANLEQYKNKLSETEIERLRADCYAGLDLIY